MTRQFFTLGLLLFLIFASFPASAQQRLSSEQLSQALKQLRPNRQVTPFVLKRFQGFSVDMNGDKNMEWILFENPNIKKKVIPPKICPCLKKKRKGKAAKLENIVQWGKGLVELKVDEPPKPKKSKKRRRRRRRISRHLRVWLSLRALNSKDLRKKAVEFCKRIRRPVRRWRLKTLRFRDTDSGESLKITWRRCSRLTRWMPTRRRMSSLRRWFRKDSSMSAMVCGCRKKKKKRGYVFRQFKPLSIIVATRVKVAPAKAPDGKVPPPPPGGALAFKLKELSSLRGTNPRLTPLTQNRKILGLRLEKKVKAGPFSTGKTVEELYVYRGGSAQQLKKVFSIALSVDGGSNNPDARQYSTLTFKQMDSDTWLEIIATHFYEDTNFTGAISRSVFKWNNGKYGPMNAVRNIRRVVVSSTWKHPASRRQRALAKQIRKRTAARNLADGFPATLWVPNRGKRGVGAWAKILFRGRQKLQGVAISTQPDRTYYPFVSGLKKSRKGFPTLIGARFVRIEAGLTFKKTVELKGKKRYHFFRFPKVINTRTLKVTIVGEIRLPNGQTKRLNIPGKERSLGFLSEIVPVSAVPRFVASSYHRGALNTFPPSAVADGVTGTGWGEGRKDSGIGEWLQMILPIPRRVSKLRFINGCNANGERYILNGRIKSARLTFSNGTSQDIQLKDGQKPQVITISPVVTSTITLTIRGVYKGKLGHITCLSEWQAL